MIIDMNKRYKTRSGLNVTILTTERKGHYPVIALIHDEESNDAVEFYSINGEYYGTGYHSLDLVEVLPLEPCPFCGSTDIMVDLYKTKSYDEASSCSIECCNCGIRTKPIFGYNTDEIRNRVISFWNTRR